MIPVGEWRPDLVSLGTEFSATATNVLPYGNSYGPAMDLATISSAVAATVTGAFQARKIDGSYAIFAFTATKIYLYVQASDTWSDVSRLVGGAYNGPASGAYWWCVQRGDDVIAGNINDNPQLFTLSTSANFALLGGSPPLAGAANIVNNYVVLSRLSGDPYTIKWGGFSTSTSWTVGTDNAGSQTFFDGGEVLGVAGRETGYVLQQNAVRQMVFQTSGPAVFSFQRIEGAKGCSAAASIINVGGVSFYYSPVGFQAISGVQSQSIGLDRVNDWFKANALSSAIPAICGAIDPRATRVAWAFQTSSAPTGTTFDRMLVYDWGRDKWTLVVCALDYLAFNGLATLGYTLEGLDAFGTVDSITISFDSSVWQGGTPAFGGFSIAHKLGFFNGATLEATVESPEVQLNPPGRSFVSKVTPYIDTSSAYVAVGGRETTGSGATVYNAEQTIGVDGKVPAKCSSRYHRLKVRVPAGTSWTELQGYDYDEYTQDGAR